jgi:hypothetical protein
MDLDGMTDIVRILKGHTTTNIDIIFYYIRFLFVIKTLLVHRIENKYVSVVSL